MFESIQVELINLAIVVLTTLAGFVAKQATSFLKNSGALAQAENNKQMVNIVVSAVEQMYKEVGGQEKFEMAKLELVKLLNEKKIKVSQTEIDLLIESAVKEMKKNIHEVKIDTPAKH